MAKLTNEQYNNISGKLGNLVYYKLNGTACVRSLPSKIKSSNSKKQIFNREKFKAMGSLYQIFRPALRYEPTKAALNKSAMFCSLNWKNVLVNSEEVYINYENLVLSNYGTNELVGLEILTAPTKVIFQWEVDNLRADNHYVLCIVYAKGLQQVYVADVKRKELSATINIPNGAGEIITYTIAHRRTA